MTPDPTRDLMNKIRVVSDEEAEASDYVICMRDVPGTSRGPFANVFGQCSRCEHPIYWSRTAPKKPPKVCINCALKLANNEEIDD